jgi:hypothetical protein
MSWWNAKYTNGNGDNEITFGSKYYERAKAVEKVCQAVIDKKVKTPDDVEVVVRCKDCKHYDLGVCLKIYSDGNAHPEAWQSRRPEDFCSYGERKDGADAEG